MLVVDPMLATGGSATAAIAELKNRGAKDVRFVGLVGCPEGVKRLQMDHPDVPIYLAALDEKLNEVATLYRTWRCRNRLLVLNNESICDLYCILVVFVVGFLVSFRILQAIEKKNISKVRLFENQCSIFNSFIITSYF